MTWQPSTYAEGLRMAWDEDDDGVEHCLAHIEPHLPETGVVVEIGSGVGRLTVPLAFRHPELQVWGFEPSVEMFAFAPVGPNLRNGTYLLDRFDFAYSVVTFQHITDDEMREYLRVVAGIGAPIVFQFVAGSEREPLSMQRNQWTVHGWCRSVGFRRVTMSKDDRFPNWRWVHAR